MRQSQAVKSHQDRNHGGHLERQGCRRGPETQQSTHRQPCANPTDRAQHPDARELLARVFHLGEGDGIGECQGRHVAQGVADEQRVKRAEAFGLGNAK